jgi:hypothetical protein
LPSFTDAASLDQKPNTTAIITADDLGTLLTLMLLLLW